MKFLKGLALGLLGFLLFLSLSVFGLVFTLNQTVLNPDFMVSEINKLDISSLAGSFFGEFLSEQIPGGQTPEGKALRAEVIDDTLADLEPWIKTQMDTAIYSGYDYLLGESQNLNLAISTDQLKETLKDNIKPALIRSIPEFASLQIPSTIDISEEMLGPEVISTLEQVREYISYIQIAYKALIGFMLLLIGLIVLTHRQVRDSTRQIGITFLAYGIPGYVGAFLINNFAMEYLPQLTGQPLLPASLQAWLPQLVNNILAPMQMFSLGILIGGVVLLVVSFVYKRKPANGTAVVA